MTRFPRWSRLLLAFLVLVVLGADTSWAQGADGADPPYRIVGYVTGGTDIADVDAEKLTHINYAFAQVTEHNTITFRDENAPAHLAQLQALKARNPDLKLLVSVGGWRAKNFSDAALTDSSRAVFAESAVDLITRYGLDGIDIDWEFPGQAVGGIEARPEDTRTFTLLLRELRTRIDSLSAERGRVGDDRSLLTIASNDDQAYFDHTEMERVHRHLDFINIMTYDFFTAGSETTGHHTALYRSAHPDAPTRTAAAAVERHLDAGIPPRKLTLGVAFYGRAWSGVRPERHGLNQPYEEFAGFIPYATLMEEYIGRRGFVRHWDESAKAPYLWAPDSAMFISYEDPRSLRHEARYVREQGLGGVMYWEHSLDYRETLLDVLYEQLR
jgi:chitinase